MVFTSLNFAAQNYKRARPITTKSEAEIVQLIGIFFTTSRNLFSFSGIRQNRAELAAAIVLISLLDTAKYPNAQKARGNSKRSKTLATRLFLKITVLRKRQKKLPGKLRHKRWQFNQFQSSHQSNMFLM